MPDPEDKDKNPPAEPDKDKNPQPPEPEPKDPGKKEPDKSKPDDGQGKIDEKAYTELRKKFTQTSQEKAELERKLEEAEKKLKPPPEPDPKSKKPSLQERLDKIKIVREKAKEEDYDTTLYDEQIDNLEYRIEQERIGKMSRQIQDDFNSFINFKNEDGNYIYMEELDKGLYTMAELDAIKEEGAKKGFHYDNEAARSILLSRNMTKYQEFNEKRKKDAKNANTPGGEMPDGNKPDAQEELRGKLFPDG